jgi:hypothetical protein
MKEGIKDTMKKERSTFIIKADIILSFIFMRRYKIKKNQQIQ